MRYIFLWLVITGVMFWAGAVRSEENRDDRGLENFARHELQKLVLPGLSSDQKKHFKVYMEINSALIKGDFDSGKVFAAKYAPVFESVEKYLPLLKKYAKRYRQAADAALEKGNDRLALQRGKAAELYEKLYKVSETILKDCNCDNQSKMDEHLYRYRLVEVEMKYYRLKVPKRGWLTCQEASKLISDWYKIKQNKEK